MVTEPTIGPLVRGLREEVGRSQSEQAELLSNLTGRPVSRNEISRWENETRLPTPYWQRFYAASFGVPIDDLRQAVSATKLQRRRQLRVGTQDGGTALRRREFVGAATVAGIAMGLPFATQLDAGRHVATNDVGRIRHRTAGLRRLDDYLGGADTYPLYAAELDATLRLVNEASYGQATGTALLSVVSEQAQQAGWAAFDAGYQAEARRLYNLSLTAAKDAEDGPLAGNALAFMAYQMIGAGQSGVETATAARDAAGPAAPSAVRALLAERLAWSHAMAGQPDAAEHALMAAQDALASDDIGDPSPDWARWVDHLEVQIMTGRCWTELHRPLRAVPILEDVLARYSGAHARDKALYLTWLANAYIDAQEIEQAARVVLRAVDLSTNVASVRPQQRIAAVALRLTPHRALQCVADVLVRIRA